MKILIFSDSHNRDTGMLEALYMHERDLDLCIHLGDGTREFLFLSEKFPHIPFVYVHGNSEDPFGNSPEAQTVLELEGHRVFLTHGHRYGVKGGTSPLVYKAMEEGCDIVLYGHTHVRENRYIPLENSYTEGIYLFNPGSISRPHYGDTYSCGLMEITKRGVLLNHIKL